MISDLYAREILDSRGYPTIEVEMTLENGIKEKVGIPSGASTGSKEALELRDNDESRYKGKGVLNAIRNVNEIIRPVLVGKKLNQIEIDNLLLKIDNTPNKSKLGANAMLGVSLVTLKCIAKSSNKELYEVLSDNMYTLPIPMVNIINGGEHANNGLAIQEFMIVPFVNTFKEKVRCASEVFLTLKDNLNKLELSTAVGDEGGFAPNLKNTKQALDLIVKSIKDAGYEPGVDVHLAIDAAASEFYKDGFYFIDGFKLTNIELTDFYLTLINEYPLISIEDPFFENDFESLTKLTKLTNNKILLVGDDFFVSNYEYLKKGIEEKAGNSILLKPNQIGTITEFLKTINYAKENDFKLIMSHRSGETTDSYLADLAVGFNTEFIKTGSVSRGERIVKYNRLMKIEEELAK